MAFHGFCCAPGRASRRGRALSRAVLALLAGLSRAHAAADDATLDPVVVSAARIEQPLGQSLPATTSISRAQIEQDQPADLVELLGREAGIEYARTGGAGSQASIFMRGSNSSQVLVLVDGVPINSVLAGAATLGGLQLDAIDHIEIVRGNLSSLYGSEAIGGVIQLFTRNPAEPGASAHLEAGTGHARGGDVAVASALGTTRIAVSAALHQERAVSALDTGAVAVAPAFGQLGANPDLDGSRGRNASARIVQPLAIGEIGAGAWTSLSDVDYDDAFEGPQAVQHAHAALSAWRVYASIAALRDLKVDLAAGQANERETDASSAPNSFLNGQLAARNRSLSAGSTWRAAPGLVVHAGFERLDQRGGALALDPNALVFTSYTRRVDAGWLGANLRAGSEQVQLNARRDHVSAVGSADTWLAAYGHAWSEHWRSTAQMSTAFRAPSFNDLYYPYFGNPALRPEHARSAEFGLRYEALPVRGSVAVFRTATRDLIVYDPAGQQANNIAAATADGVELAAATVAGHWSVNGNLTCLSARDRASGAPLLRRAGFVGNLGTAWQSGAWRFGGEVSRVRARSDTNVDPPYDTVRLDPYWLARLTGLAHVRRGLDLTLRVENLFNAHYRLASGYNVTPRMVVGGIAWRL